MGLKDTITGWWRTGDGNWPPSSDPVDLAAMAAAGVPPMALGIDGPAGDQNDFAPVDRASGNALLRIWSAFYGRYRSYEHDAGQASGARRADSIQRRIEALAGTPPDPVLLHDALSVLHDLAVTWLDDLNERLVEFAHGSRDHTRISGARELRLSQLHDEVQLCRTLIEQEWARRTATVPASESQVGLHDRLNQFLAVVATGRGGDEIALAVQALDRLIDSNDAAALALLPEWLKRPAARVVEVVAERNRYRRMLVERGIIPATDTPTPPPRE